MDVCTGLALKIGSDSRNTKMKISAMKVKERNEIAVMDFSMRNSPSLNLFFHQSFVDRRLSDRWPAGVELVLDRAAMCFGSGSVVLSTLGSCIKDKREYTLVG
jgi:hypothetical protein